jgi:hypothetical protein
MHVVRWGLSSGVETEAFQCGDQAAQTFIIAMALQFKLDRPFSVISSIQLMVINVSPSNAYWS